MFRLFLFLLLACASGISHATCFGSGISYGTPLNFDLSDKLSMTNTQWTTTVMTQYVGAFNCTTGNSEFAYTPILSTDSSKATILSFGKYNVRAEIVNKPTNPTLASAGRHAASELNTPMSLRFTLVSGTGTTVAGNTMSISDVMFVSDMSGMSIWEILTWPITQAGKILTWLFNGFHWPYDSRDMYGQPMTIKYAPAETTCAFDNAGLTVVLPKVGISQLGTSSQPGITPFTLNMRCQNLNTDSTSTRAVDMFLSSNNLLPTDSSVLVDSSTSAAKGVGIRVVKTSSAGKPVVFSTSATSRGTATSLFSVTRGGAMTETISIPMAAYYEVFNTRSVSQGNINTAAVLNIVYP